MLVTTGVAYLWRFARKFVDKLGGGEWEWQSGASALHFSLHNHVSVGSRLQQSRADQSKRTLWVAETLSSRWMSNKRAVFF